MIAKYGADVGIPHDGEMTAKSDKDTRPCNICIFQIRQIVATRKAVLKEVRNKYRNLMDLGKFEEWLENEVEKDAI